MRGEKAGTRSTGATDQIAASIAKAFNDVRATEFGVAMDRQFAAFVEAMNEVENVFGYLRDPSGQLGNPSTKHGEIAEAVEIGIRRAHDCLNEVPASISDEGISRTSPVDYILNGVEAQSKFINGTASGLRHVLAHTDNNQPFVQGGGVYVIPKDQYETILRVIAGDTKDMSKKTVTAIQQHIEKIAEQAGRPALEILKPSISTYSDVQPGNIEATMEQHQDQVEQHHEQRKEEIHDAHQASFAEGIKATLTAAAVGVTVGFAAAAFQKYKQGKNIFRGDFDKEDWRDVGGEAAMGAAGGALTGAAVYLMTNSLDLSAPLAGAFVAAAKGLAPLVSAYSRGSITKEELIDAGLFVCCDVALIGVCTAAGQSLIPIPVLGAMIGSIAGKCLSSLLESQLNGATKAIQQRLQDILNRLNSAQRALVAEIVERYDSLGDLATRAFDVSSNAAMLQLSVELARAHAVPEHLILRNDLELDSFMRS
jgi:hypothetical protein